MAKKLTRPRIMNLDDYQELANHSITALARLLDMDVVHDKTAVAAVLDAASVTLHEMVTPAQMSKPTLVGRTLETFFSEATAITDRREAFAYEKIRQTMTLASMRKKIFDTVCDYHTLSL